MTRLRVASTPVADQHVEAIHAWWLVHRRDAPGLFLDELQATIERVLQRPSLGVRYPRSSVAGMRRILLRRTGYHVYYSYSPERAEVVLRAIWHAARGRQPRLR